MLSYTIYTFFHLISILYTSFYFPLFDRYLNELRLSPNRWSIGLDLFFKTDSAVSRFFGLSLVRDYLLGNRSEIPAEHRVQIRQLILSWLLTACQQNTSIPSYIENNIATVLTRALKLDFPLEWPSAFKDILAISGMGSLLGFTVALRVITELDAEVIMFDERRSGEEISHNSLIKDTMRQQNIVKDIVEFLCQSITLLRNSSYQVNNTIAITTVGGGNGNSNRAENS